MTNRLGENIQREWDEEPLAAELWDALQVRKRDGAEGIALLNDLAGRGSVLAMMYLGHAQVLGEEEGQVALGEQWLIKSAAGGSIEGRFQLAQHYWRQNDGRKALDELKALASQGYAPAMYYLGLLLFRGELIEKSVPEAVGYLKMAMSAGHLPSMGLLSQIYRKEKFGIGGRIASHWLCLLKLPALIGLLWRYPSSDRLRPLVIFPRS